MDVTTDGSRVKATTKDCKDIPREVCNFTILQPFDASDPLKSVTTDFTNNTDLYIQGKGSEVGKISDTVKIDAENTHIITPGFAQVFFTSFTPEGSGPSCVDFGGCSYIETGDEVLIGTITWKDQSVKS